MNQFILLLVGFCAISNAQVIYDPRAVVAAPATYAAYAAPAVVATPAAYAAPAVIAAPAAYAAPAVVAAPAVHAAPAIAPVLPTVIPATELNDWETFKTKFGKIYAGDEDLFRFGIYFANKEKVAKYDELIFFGLGNEKLVLDSFADFTRDEILNLRAREDIASEEWESYKELYGKSYDGFEEKFRKTVYFIVKDTIEAHNKIVDAGFLTPKLEITKFTDYFHYELPSEAPVLPSATTILSSPAAASIPIAKSFYPSYYI